MVATKKADTSTRSSWTCKPKHLTNLHAFDSDKLKLAAKVAEDLANENAQNQSKLAILNLAHAKFKTLNLTIKPYKYMRIFSLQAAQKLALHINLRRKSKKLHENEFGK